MDLCINKKVIIITFSVGGAHGKLTGIMNECF